MAPLLARISRLAFGGLWPPGGGRGVATRELGPAATGFGGWLCTAAPGARKVNAINPAPLMQAALDPAMSLGGANGQRQALYCPGGPADPAGRAGGWRGGPTVLEALPGRAQERITEKRVQTHGRTHCTGNAGSSSVRRPVSRQAVRARAGCQEGQPDHWGGSAAPAALDSPIEGLGCVRVALAHLGLENHVVIKFAAEGGSDRHSKVLGFWVSVHLLEAHPTAARPQVRAGPARSNRETSQGMVGKGQERPGRPGRTALAGTEQERLAATADSARTTDSPTRERGQRPARQCQAGCNC